MKIKFVVNPRAGRGQGHKIYTEIMEWHKKLSRPDKPEIDISFTSRSGIYSAANLASQAVRDGYERIVAVGGDGTVNEVINGLAGADVIFGIIPVGGANDFARALGIPKDIESALNVVESNNVIPVDLGQVNDRYFANAFSLGFDVRIHRLAQEFKKEHQLWSNDKAYLVASFKTLFSRLNYLEARIYSLGPSNSLREISGRAVLIAVTNTLGYAKILRMSPQASFQDGFLNLCWIEKIPKWKMLITFIRTLVGVHTRMVEVKTLKTSRMSISSPEEVVSQIDGEILPAQKKFKIKVIPKALKVLVPK